MRYRELVTKERELWNSLDTEKEREKLELILKIIKETFNKISVSQAMEIVSKLSDTEIKYLLNTKRVSSSEIRYLMDIETIRIVINPHEMAEILKVYEFECEKPPSKAYWKVNSSYESEKDIKILYGDCTFLWILQKFKYTSIYNVTLDSEEILQECDFDVNQILVVLVTEPAYSSIPSKCYMYIYLPT